MEEGLQQGLQQVLLQGALRQARQAILDVLQARFHAIPEDVRQAVEQADRLEVLRAWHQAAVRAPDAAAAAAILASG